ncbi:hypothetical protein [Gemmatimonas groenlandica]|uniref:Plastocyanin-like domain-containing protein n=1 Tax=Gemmatimonas groenlandica TaxID=2732249 RepID=A0A6M4IL17_9BACT|nr:hypothetical protein [Gemmatimonas groenlandica]QJR35413.1 hypothetical protein HKW67_07785 [Gemmatimonas groenlandica]
MSDTTVPRLSSLVDRLLEEDSPPFHRLYADDQAVLVLDSTEIVQPAPAGSTDRRAFLARASLLSLAIPGVGPALAACAPAGDADYATASRDTVGWRVASTDNSTSRYAPLLPPETASDQLARRWYASATPERTAPVTVRLTKEFVIVQTEFYLADAGNGTRAFDDATMKPLRPDFVAFSDRHHQYMDAQIRVTVGDCVRLWVVPATPAYPSHVQRGVPSVTAPGGGGAVFELVCDVAGEFPFVNHGFGHGQKGAIGLLLVDP